jgi:uncharacterized protein YbjT (DUF2867 family)
MKILILGGTGLLGHDIVKYLSKKKIIKFLQQSENQVRQKNLKEIEILK